VVDHARAAETAADHFAADGDARSRMIRQVSGRLVSQIRGADPSTLAVHRLGRPAMKFVVYSDGSGDYRSRLVATNGLVRG
jgi:hypothetical protein